MISYLPEYKIITKQVRETAPELDCQKTNTNLLFYLYVCRFPFLLLFTLFTTTDPLLFCFISFLTTVALASTSYWLFLSFDCHLWATLSHWPCHKVEILPASQPFFPSPCRQRLPDPPRPPWLASLAYWAPSPDHLQIRSRLGSSQTSMAVLRIFSLCQATTRLASRASTRMT